MQRIALASALVLSAAAFSTQATAATIQLDSYTNALPYADTRANGSTSASAESVDGTHQLVRIATTESGNTSPNQEKVAPFFYNGTLGQPLGTLGDLARGGLTFDWKHESGTAVFPIPAIRLLVSGVNGNASSVAEIVWESSYQPQYAVPNAGFPAGGSVNDQDAGSGNFWVRFNGQNYAQGDNGPGQSITLAQWASGAQFDAAHAWPTFGDGSLVYGLTTSIGSNAGDFVGYVGDIQATFTAVPEPTTLAAIAGGAVLLLGRRRRGA